MKISVLFTLKVHYGKAPEKLLFQPDIIAIFF